jgi:hypothetical protein
MANQNKHFKLAMRQAKAIKHRKDKKRAVRTLCKHWRRMIGG